ncbi:hypothetical protein FACS1894137_19020 [Spirochaetia bacterium]|nr:hypothetical protein FACS1894137_19020 [Spirochaetia bacterium]
MKNGKRFFLVMFSMAMAFGTLSGCITQSHTWDFETDGFIYQQSRFDFPLVMIGYTGVAKEVIIPREFTIRREKFSRRVAGIRELAFKGKNLTSVVIPDSVTSIGSDAFINNNLTSVTIGNKVKFISNPFDNNFAAYYNGPAKQAAGTYTYDGNEWTLKGAALTEDPAPTQSAARTQVAQSTVPAEPVVQAPISDIIVQGSSFTEKLDWLKVFVQSNGNYIFEINADESIVPQDFKYSGKSNIIITLKGVGSNRVVSLSSGSSMFTVGSGVTLILENNIILRNRNYFSNLIFVETGGKFIMNKGSTITGNSKGGESNGVTVRGGTFIMNGGEISDNKDNGVLMVGGTFTMNDGAISGNSSAGVGTQYDAVTYPSNLTISKHNIPR